MAVLYVSTIHVNGDDYYIKDTTARNQIANKADIDSPTFTGTPKSVTPTAGDSSTNIATTAFVSDAIATAISGAAAYRGTVANQTALANAAPYKAGEYWFVSAAGTIAGEKCEVGDMIVSKAAASSYSASNFNVVQTNIDPSIYAKAADLGELAFVDNASATYTPSGSVGTPTITVTPNTTTVNSITAVGTLPTWGASVNEEVLSFSWSQGTLPTKGNNTTVVTGIQSATSSKPTWTGTQATITVSKGATGGSGQ